MSLEVNKRRRTRSNAPRPARANRTNYPQQDANKTVEIKFTLPSFSKLGRYKRLLTLTAVVLVLGLVSFGMYLFLQPDSQRTAEPLPVQGLEQGTPDYSTVIPKGKDIDELGGWTRVSPPNAEPVYTYVDELDGVRITVSQQPLPNNFKTNTSQKIEELASSFGATEKVNVGDTAIFIGASINGPESVIFSQNELLILIKSDAGIETDQWINYIDSLK